MYTCAKYLVSFMRIFGFVSNVLNVIVMVGSRYGVYAKLGNISYNTHTMFIIGCYKCLDTFRSYYTYFFDLRNRVEMVARWGLDGLIFRRTRRRSKGRFYEFDFWRTLLSRRYFCKENVTETCKSRGTFKSQQDYADSRIAVLDAMIVRFRHWFNFLLAALFFLFHRVAVCNIWKTFFFLSYLECFERDARICIKVAAIIICLVNWTIVNRVEWNLSKRIFSEAPDKKMFLYTFDVFLS